MSRVSFEYVEKHTDTGYTDTVTLIVATKLWIQDEKERQQVLRKIKNVSSLEKKELTVPKNNEIVTFDDIYYNTKITNPYNSKETFYGFSYRCLTGYLSIRLKHNVIYTRKPATIIKELKEYLSKHFHIEDKYLNSIDDYIFLGRIDYKRDYKYRTLEEYYLIKQIIDIAPDTIIRSCYSKEDKADTEFEYIKAYKSKSNKTAQFVMYDKHKDQEHSLKRGEIDELDYEKYYHTIRFEVRLLNSKLNAIKKAKEIPKKIHNYKDEEKAKEYFDYYATKAFFTEPIFRIDIAKEKVNQSNLKDNMKVKLCNVLDSINTRGYSKTRNIYTDIVTNSTGKQQKNYSKFNRYIEKIRGLNINPLTLRQTWRDDKGNIADTTYTEIPNFILAENCLEEECMFIDE